MTPAQASALKEGAQLIAAAAWDSHRTCGLPLRDAVQRWAYLLMEEALEISQCPQTSRSSAPASSESSVS